MHRNKISGGHMTEDQRFAFVDSALNRAAYLRDGVQSRKTPAKCLMMWRGKPLVMAATETGTGLGWIDAAHPLVDWAEELSAAKIFLGLSEDDENSPNCVSYFAYDLSAWEPEADVDTMQPGFFDASVQRHPLCPEEWSFVELRGLLTQLSIRDAELAATARAMFQWHDSHRFCAKCGAGSEIAMGGWQRNCPACRASHFPRTDPVVIMLITHGNRALLGRSAPWPKGMYSCLAGFIEPGETIEAAVRREVFEETHVQVGPVSYVASQPWPFPSSLMIGCRGGAKTDEIILDPNELEDALWITREEGVEVLAGQHPQITPPRKGSIAQYLLQNWLADQWD